MNLENNASPWASLISLLERLIYYSTSEMFIRLNCNNSEFIISMPDFLIQHIPDGLYERGMMRLHGDARQELIFRGIQIVPSPDLAITLYHKDYPLYQKDWMIKKIPLMPIQKKKKEWYDVYLLKLTEAPYFANSAEPGSN